MPLTDADWGEVQNLIDKMVGKAGIQPFVQAPVAAVDESKRLIYVAELADIPIPMVEFKHEVKVYHSVDPGTPIGSWYAWPTDVAPTNHVFLNGQSLSKTTWPELFDVLGYAHGGSGDNFNVPDWKGRTPVMFDAAQAEFDALHEVGGVKSVALTPAQGPIKNHTHTDGTLTVASHDHGGGNHNHPATNLPVLGTAGSAQIGSGTDFAGNNEWRNDPVQASGNIITAQAPDVTGATGNPTAESNGADHTNLQPYKVANFIMRAKSSSGLEEPQTTIQKRVTTPLLPNIGEVVLIAMLMGERRMPRCLGVISAPANYLVHPGEQQ